MPSLPDQLLAAADCLSAACSRLHFPEPVHTVYNAFDHARAGYAAYLRRFAHGSPRFLFLGMNPGPWGMAQTGVPFGEVAAVRDWMGLQAEIAKPQPEHPQRPVQGFACSRSEVSGRRLWGLFAAIYGTPENCFAECLVLNYCPLSFIRHSGANLTPDKLPAAVRDPLHKACDHHLQTALELLQPAQLIGIGGYATRCLQRVDAGQRPVHTLLHPSPASPAANKHWPHRPRSQLAAVGIPGAEL